LTFATPFALSAIFALIMTLTARNSLQTVVMGLAALLPAVFLVFTGARQSLLGLGVAVAVLIAWLLGKKRTSRGLTLLIVIMMTIVGWRLYASTALGARWAFTASELESRVGFWNYGWRVFLDSPFWGSGLDYRGPLDYAHNLILDTMASQGLVGLTFLFGFIMLVLRAARGSWAGTGNAELAVWRMGLLCAFVYVMIHSQFSGSVTGTPHFLWVPALIYRLGILARLDKSRSTTVALCPTDTLIIEQPTLSGSKAHDPH
jgi:O-antigen ligase